MWVCYVLGKWLLKKWREFFSQFYFLKLQTKRGLGRTQGATFQVDFLDQDLLWWWKVHIKIFLMRGQIVFLIYKELVIELLKHDFFFCPITVFDALDQNQPNPFCLLRSSPHTALPLLVFFEGWKLSNWKVSWFGPFDNKLAVGKSENLVTLDTD